MMHHQPICDNDRFIRRLATPSPPVHAIRAQHMNQLQQATRRFKRERFCFNTTSQIVKQQHYRPNLIRTLDAPALRDDFYTHPLSWSSRNWLAVVLFDKIWAYNCSRGSEQSPLWINQEACELNRSNVEINNESSDALSAVDAVQWSDDGCLLAFSSPGQQCSSLDVYDFETRQNFLSYDNVEMSPIKSLHWRQNLLACGCEDGNVLLLDPRCNKSSQIFSSSNARVCGTMWSPNCQVLAVGTDDNNVQVWDIRQASQSICSFHHATSAVKALAWSSDSLLFAGGGKADCCVRKYCISRAELLATGQTQTQITSLNYNCAQRELVSTHRRGGGAISKWSASDLHLLTFTPQSGGCIGASLSPCNTQIAIASSLDLVTMWQIWPTMNVKRQSSNFIHRLRKIATIR